MEKIVATNRKAYHDYRIEETMEAGVSLLGTEVKALREGRVNLRDSFARVEEGQTVMHHCHISPYSHKGAASHEPLRPRQLLLHRREIERLWGKTRRHGYTIVPLRLYFTRGLAKVELALAKGRTHEDRREQLKQKIQHREAEQAIKQHARKAVRS